jgi:tetratricopeptide (TPR) repeat protein
MSAILHPHFLMDAAEYDRAAGAWLTLWSGLPSPARAGWETPWVDESWRDGNPIFSAWSPALRKGIRIIQHEGDEENFVFWSNTFGGASGSPGTVDELVISCAQTPGTMGRARELVVRWLADAAMPPAFVQDRPERIYERQIVALHRLLAEGGEGSQDHRELLGRMLATREQIDPDKRAFMDRVSGDLRMLSGTEIVEDDGVDPDDIRTRLTVAWNLQDDALVLALLRKKGALEAYSPENVAFIRARCLKRLGYPEAGLALMDHAWMLSQARPMPVVDVRDNALRTDRSVPTDGNYAWFVLGELMELGRLDEAAAKAETLAMSASVSARGLLAAAMTLVALAAWKGTEARSLYERAAAILRRALDSLEPLRSVRVGARVLLGFCHEHLGQAALALRTYTDALAADPGSDIVLVARAALLLSSDEPAAARDFASAVDAGTPVVWPYLYLAHRHLKHEDYARCADLCERGLSHATEPAEKANLYEWLAIAQTALGAPAAAVEEIFARALEAAPFNLRIRHNRDAFRAALSAASPTSWEIRNDTPPEHAKRSVERHQLALAAAA